MRDSVTFSRREVTPLIPDPPIKRPRVKQRSNACHQCWSRFTCCSKWTCIFISILVIVLVLIIVRSVLPFGWPWWAPTVEFDASDPHIIMIVADDIGWGDLGYGGAEFPTKSIDELRQSGISLNKMYAHESGSATRAALLTGVPGYALGLQSGIDTGSSAHIPASAQLLPEMLRDHRGYRTAMVGKWALGYSKWAYTPTQRGFGSFFGFHQRYIDYWHYSATIEGDVSYAPLSKNKNNEVYCGYDLWRDNKPFTPTRRMQYATELFDDEIATLIDEHAASDSPEQPMFLYYTPPNAHAPIQYHFEYDHECSYIKETSELIRWKYCNLMQELDRSIGKLVDKLKEHQMWERSIIVFTSDNGGLMCWDVGSVNSCSGSVNLPLRGGKGTLFEGAIRVRTIISGGYLDEELRGTTSDELMHSTDLFATLADAAHIEHEQIYGDDDARHVTGLPFWEYLTSQGQVNTEGEVVSVSAPLRDGPFIADMQLDESASYIEKAALFWKGYKYIIQPIEQYDGWWQSPLQGPSEMPDDAAGVHTEPQQLAPRKGPSLPDEQSVAASSHVDGVDGAGTSAATQSSVQGQGPAPGDEDAGEISWSSLRMNEYLFLIDEDPAETNNVGRAAEHEDILYQLREFLSDLAGSPRDYVKQDTATSIHSDPAKFDNVWWPFEEKFE